MTTAMKDALKGQGGALQSVSTLLGETVAGNSDLRSASSKKTDEATSSLSDLANPTRGASTTEGTKISGRQQVENMSSGSADHLDLAFRKEDD